MYCNLPRLFQIPLDPSRCSLDGELHLDDGFVYWQSGDLVREEVELSRRDFVRLGILIGVLLGVSSTSWKSEREADRFILQLSDRRNRQSLLLILQYIFELTLVRVRRFWIIVTLEKLW